LKILEIDDPVYEFSMCVAKIAAVLQYTR
jgi:hypothetical protein